jgi:hypothetical protein
LVEALVAIVLVCTAVAGLAHLGLAAMVQSAVVERESVALWLAQSKLEELRASEWIFDDAGVRRSADVLALSPADALTRDSGGYVDAFDRFGEPVPLGVAAAHRRRWAISLVDPLDPDTLLLQSCVVPRSASDARTRPDACVATIRTRHRK